MKPPSKIAGSFEQANTAGRPTLRVHFDDPISQQSKADGTPYDAFSGLMTSCAHPLGFTFRYREDRHANIIQMSFDEQQHLEAFRAEMNRRFEHEFLEWLKCSANHHIQAMNISRDEFISILVDQFDMDAAQVRAALDENQRRVIQNSQQIKREYDQEIVERVAELNRLSRAATGSRINCTPFYFEDCAFREAELDPTSLQDEERRAVFLTYLEKTISLYQSNAEYVRSNEQDQQKGREPERDQGYEYER